MPPAGRRKALIDQPEGADDAGILVGKQGIGDPVLCGKPRMNRHRIIGHERHAVTELAEFLDALIPDDRLALAEGSPVEGAREQHDQPAAARQRLERLITVVLITARKT